MRSIFPYIFIALAIGLFFFFGRPLYRDVTSLKGDVGQYNVALDHSTDLQKVRDDLASRYSNITQSNKDRLMHFLPNSVDNIQLILELEKMAALRGITLKNITFTPPQTINEIQQKSNQSYGVFDLQFKTQANYETFVLFTKDLERNLRQIDIKGITFSINDTTRFAGLDPSMLDFTVNIQTYWLK